MPAVSARDGRRRGSRLCFPDLSLWLVNQLTHRQAAQSHSGNMTKVIYSPCPLWYHKDENEFEAEI
jgi:hypothetical protein